MKIFFHNTCISWFDESKSSLFISCIQISNDENENEKVVVQEPICVKLPIVGRPVLVKGITCRKCCHNRLLDSSHEMSLLLLVPSYMSGKNSEQPVWWAACFDYDDESSTILKNISPPFEGESIMKMGKRLFS